MNDELGKDLEGSDRDLIELLSQNFLEDIEKSHVRGYPEPRLEFKFRTFRRQMYSVTARSIEFSVACLLHARTVAPQKRPLLGNTRKQEQNNGVVQPRF
jgi:hypothetical protein